MEDLFQINEFQKINNYIESILTESNPFNSNKPPQKQLKIKAREVVFSIRIIFFSDKSFEINIKKAEPISSYQFTGAESNEIKNPD